MIHYKPLKIAYLLFRANILDLLPLQKSFLKNKENKWIYNLNPEVTYFNKF